jgi:DNA-binding PadR family transcriptional regulator
VLPIEYDILEWGTQLERSDGGFYGFGLARALADARGQTALIGHGTLYKALGRMTDRGLLESEWEDAELAVSAGRPRRRLYRVTGEGARILAARPAPEGSPERAARVSLA